MFHTADSTGGGGEPFHPQVSEMKGIIMCVVPIEEMLAEISCKLCLIKTLITGQSTFRQESSH